MAEFFRRRWRGEVPLAILFWRDMVLIGTILNIAATGMALLLLASEWPLAAVLLVHFATMPYNLFLVAAIWRSAKSTDGWLASAAPLAAAAWLAVATTI